MAVSVMLNGHMRQFEAATLSELVAELGLRADRVAAERNGEIVPRADWAAVQLAEGDKLEVVHFVGGGSAKAAQPPPLNICVTRDDQAYLRSTPSTLPWMLTLAAGA